MIGSTGLATGRTTPFDGLTTGGVRIWLSTSPLDMRKSFDGLAEVVRTFLGHDPLCGSLFVFRNRSAQRIKILFFDAGGLAIYYKRLEKGTFQFPASGEKSIAVSSEQLVRLLSGMELEARR